MSKFVNDTGFVVVDQIGTSFNEARTNPAVYMSTYLQRAAFLAEDAAYMKLRFVHLSQTHSSQRCDPFGLTPPSMIPCSLVFLFLHL